MDISSQVKEFAPVSGWKQWAGLIVIVVLVIALGKKFGVQAKVNKTVGAGA